jgi:hypothetical protein
VDAPARSRSLAGSVWWSLAGLWTFVVVFVCLLRGSFVSQWIKALIGLTDELGVGRGLIDDRVLHYGSFLVLGLLYATALGEGSWRRIERRPLLRTLAALILLGALLEGGQHFVPRRTPDLPDLLANTLGILSGMLVPGLMTLRAGGGGRGASSTG